MKVIYDLNNLDLHHKKSALTLGEFDGMHKGHVQLIRQTIWFAKKYNLITILLTYYPSPKQVLKKISKEQSCLFTQEEKIKLLESFNLDYLVILNFNSQLRNMQASSFLKNILLGKLNMQYIILGYDHHFGKNRHGNYQYLKLASRKHHFKVDKIKAVSFFKNIISSHKIRLYIKNGFIKKANKFLGFYFHITGTVVHGFKRGEKIQIPTINISFTSDKVLPKQGVYVGAVLYNNFLYKSVINIGKNPTFNNKEISIEAHILNFKKNIYNEKVIVYFVDYIREEKKFDNLLDLKQQIEYDIQFAIKTKV